MTRMTDPTNGLVFPDLSMPPFAGNEDLQANLIMPEPTVFLSRSLPVCSIVRPTETQGAAMGAVRFLTAMGLFIGQIERVLRRAERAGDASRPRPTQSMTRAGPSWIAWDFPGSEDLARHL